MASVGMLSSGVTIVLAHSGAEARIIGTKKRGADLVYSGRIGADDLLDEPDLLRKETKGYVPGAITSESGLEGSQ